MVIIKSEIIPQGFDELADSFIKDSFDYEMNVESIKEQINFVLEEQRGAFWTIWDKGDLSGYFFCEVLPAEYGGFVCIVKEAFVKKSGIKLAKEIENTVEDWARKHSIDELVFYTRRNPIAFMNALNKGWKIDSFVLKKRLIGE